MKRNAWIAGAVLALALAVPVLARGGGSNSSDSGTGRGGGRSESSSSSSGSSRGSSGGSNNSRSGSGSTESGPRRDGPGRTGSERGGGGSKADKGNSGKSNSDQGGSGTDTNRRNGPTDRGRDDTDLRPHRPLDRDHGDRRDHHRGYRWGYPGYYGLFGGYDYYGYGSLESRDDDRPFKGGDNIDIRVKPDNAQVYVNGLLYSNKGKAKFGLPSGPWKIEIRAPGYLTQIIELNVEQGIRYTIERKLEKDLEQGPDGRPLKTEELNRTD